MQKQPEVEETSPEDAEREIEQSMPTKLAIELGPLLIFFGMNAAQGIYAATAAFMIATIAALAYAFVRYRKIPVMPLVSGVIVMVFGGLTLYLQDATFIKLKPTIVYLIFAGVLFGGLLMRKPLLQLLFGPAFALSEEGWRKLTYRWIGFFIVMAVVNEIVWRNFSTDFWVSFKAFGFLPLTLVFALLQMPLLQRYGEVADEEERAR
ncbi:MAG: septation protein A [Methyloligella sp. ZOD6]